MSPGQAAHKAHKHAAGDGDAHGHDHHGHGPGHDAHGHAHDHGHSHAHAPAAAAAPDALISLRGIRVVRDGRTLLEGVDLDIEPGEIVTVIGPNGAGKTTLVRVLLGVVQPDVGTIKRKSGLAVGYVPQRFDIDAAIPMTVRRFLGLGGSSTPAAIDMALGEVGALHVREQQVSVLSGGELQRVMLARALLRRPSLLVLDEPARGVDHAGEADLYQLIARLTEERGFGVLLVSHDLHVVMARSDRVVCINRHICCEGVPQQVARDPEYARLFGPDAARAVALYHHSHDHHHDLAGAPLREDEMRDG